MPPCSAACWATSASPSPEPGPLRGPAAAEAVEHRGPLVGRDPRAVVVHGDQHAVAAQRRPRPRCGVPPACRRALASRLSTASRRPAAEPVTVTSLSGSTAPTATPAGAARAAAATACATRSVSSTGAAVGPARSPAASWARAARVVLDALLARHELGEDLGALGGGQVRVGGEHLEVGAHAVSGVRSSCSAAAAKSRAETQRALALAAGQLHPVQQPGQRVGDLRGLGGAGDRAGGEGGAVGRAGASAEPGRAVPQLPQWPGGRPGQQPAEAGRRQRRECGDEHVTLRTRATVRSVAPRRQARRSPFRRRQRGGAHPVVRAAAR